MCYLSVSVHVCLSTCALICSSTCARLYMCTVYMQMGMRALHVSHVCELCMCLMYCSVSCIVSCIRAHVFASTYAQANTCGGKHMWRQRDVEAKTKTSRGTCRGKDMCYTYPQYRAHVHASTCPQSISTIHTHNICNINICSWVCVRCRCHIMCARCHIICLSTCACLYVCTVYMHTSIYLHTSIYSQYICTIHTRKIYAHECARIAAVASSALVSTCVRLGICAK